VPPCGTALTNAQARTLNRFTSKVVLSFDPDTAGRTATARSSEVLVPEGFHVNVALLPAGNDPDVYIRKNGGRAYVERLTQSQPYLEFLLDRASTGLDLNRPDNRKQFLDAMLTVAATIPDPAVRDQFADRLSHKARITEAVVRDLIRAAAAQKKTAAPALAVPTSVTVRPAEQGLLWALMHRPVEGLAAVTQLEPEDLEGVLAAPILRLAAALGEMPPDVLPELLRERLNEGERALLDRAAAAEAPVAPAADCVNTFRRLRVERDLASVQDEIDRLQERSEMTDARLSALWERKKELLKLLEELRESGSRN
jgi:DNA primase